MSERIPESIPTSQDPRSKRPTKKRALTPVSEQAASLTALFSKPDQEIRIPASSSSALTNTHHGAPPEIVANVQGSSAGAGSGEFHVYKASRRREYERLRAMDEEVRNEKDGVDFDKERAEREERDREKTRKNREKREKMKARRGKGKAAGESREDKLPTGDRAGGIKGPRLDGHRAETEIDVDANAMEGVQEVGLVIHDDD